MVVVVVVTWQLVLPKGLRTNVLKQFHDNPVGGHLGVSKTLAKAVGGSLDSLPP